MPALPDWVTLRIYLAAVELGSITKAAEQCGIAPAAAVKRIQTLEAESGVTLLERGARGVRPTEAGKAFAQHGRALLALAARLTADIRGFAVGSLGKVRVSAIASAVARVDFASMLAAFSSMHPSIEVELQEDTSLPIAQDVLHGHIDLGLISLDAPMPAGLEQRPWREYRLLAVVSAGHHLGGRSSVGFTELMDYPLIGQQEGSDVSALLEQAANRLGREFIFRFRPRNTDAIRRLVAAGHGITIMPDAVATPYLATLGLSGIPLTDDWSHGWLKLVSREAASLPPPVRLLRDHMLRSATPLKFA